MHINDLVKIAVSSGVSDLHLKVASYPMMRLNGSLVVAAEDKRLDRRDTEAMAQAVFTGDHLEKIRKSQEVDLAYSVPGLGRFRVNVFQQRGTVGMVLRVIPTRIKTIDELGLPPVLKRIGWASNVDEFKLKVQGISTTADMAREELTKKPAGGSGALTRFGG
jgi:twitching motility protein PilT